MRHNLGGGMVKPPILQKKYRAHLRKENKWLPWVTGYSVSDAENGYAGIIGHPIDAIQIVFI